MLRRLLSPENIAALVVCIILIFISILTADQTPQWIYQGF
jgi:hypothetical protein